MSSLSCSAYMLARSGWAPRPRLTGLGWLEDPLPIATPLATWLSALFPLQVLCGGNASLHETLVPPIIDLVS